MRKRQDICEMFSTFLKVDDSKSYLGSKLEFSPKLVRNMTKKIEEEPKAPEEFWAKYWLKEALKNPHNELARGHFSAYLEESCYSVTSHIFQQLPNIHLSQVDCFLIARETAANPAKIFKTYKFSSASVKTYAYFPLRTAILDLVHLAKDLEGDSHTGVLRKLTKKKLQETLQKAKIKESDFSNCLLAWQCFKEIYAPTKIAGNRQLQPPDESQLKAMAELYNQRRKTQELPIDWQKIERLLATISTAVRERYNIRHISLEDCVNEATLVSDNPLDNFDSPSEEQKQVNSVLSQAFATLSTDLQKMLQLSYGLDFKQTDFGDLFKKDQPQISRQCKEGINFLCDRLTNWSQEHWGMTINSSNLAENAKQIKMWLKTYCQQPVQELLNTTLNQDFADKGQLVMLLFGDKLKPKVVAEKLKISEDDVTKNLTDVKQKLQVVLKEWVEETLAVNLTGLDCADKQLEKVIDKWLKNVD